MKSCNKCKIDKPLSDYCKNAKYRDGHIGRCKSCMNEIMKAHRLKKSKNEPWFIFD